MSDYEDMMMNDESDLCALTDTADIGTYSTMTESNSCGHDDFAQHVSTESSEYHNAYSEGYEEQTHESIEEYPQPTHEQNISAITDESESTHVPPVATQEVHTEPLKDVSTKQSYNPPQKPKSANEGVKKQKNTTSSSSKAKANSSKKGTSNNTKQNDNAITALVDKTKAKIESIDKKTVINTVDTTLVKSVKLVQNIGNRFDDKSKFKTDICQNFIPIKDFIGNMLLTSDNRYVKILEILPINFYDKTPYIADNIIHNFSKLFYSGLLTHQFKVVCDKSNPYKLIEFIRQKNKKEKNEKVLAQAEDTINTIKRIAESGGLSKRFFLIFEYEGENGKKSNNLEEIYEQMNLTENQIVQAFNSMGNYVLVPEVQKEAMFYSEILYYHFNKRTCRNESVNDRLVRLYNDKYLYNSETGEDKEIVITDVCSPRGIDLRHKTYAKIDGSYYTYITLTDESYIQTVRAGWLDIFTRSDGFELDIIIKRLPKELTDMYMNQKIKFKRVNVRRASHKDQDKYETLSQELNDDYYIKSMLNRGDSLYNVCCVITIRAESYRSLLNKKKVFMREFKKEGITFEEAYCNMEEYVLMTMPLLMYDKSIFNRNAHNFTTTQLASLYMFTAYELYDTKGFIMGINERNDTIASINQFNSQMYRNANMMILGTSGAGKSFTEMTLGWRMRIAGIRVFYVLPVKGYEYMKMCNLIGGTYIKLAPSLNNCINFLEVRPETTIDTTALEDGVVFENTSWLAKTMITATTFITLLMKRDLTPRENTKLSVAMRRMYNDYGITDDNQSIFVDGTKKLKRMPVPTNLLAYIKDDSAMEDIADVLEEFNTGSLQNFNNQTNVDLSNMFTVFDVDENDMGERFLPAFMFLAINIVYSACKANRLTHKAIILDEVWKCLVNEESAKQIQMMIKLVRGYGASAIMATQDIIDFARTPFGSSVISNTSIKFILKLEESEVKEVAKHITLSERDISDILDFKRGHGLFIANNDKTKIHIIPSQKEIEAFTTDTNILRQIANIEE